MDEVDTTVGEHDECRELVENGLPATCRLVDVPVKLGIAVQLEQEPRDRERDHDWNGCGGLPDFHIYLIFEVSRMVEVGLVVDKGEGGPSDEEIEQPAEY